MEVVPGIYVVELPLPFESNRVNCYLLKGSSGWTIIDAGPNYLPCTGLWEKTFKRMGIKYGDIEGVYISHLHPCHYGASGWLQELTGAPVYMCKGEIDSVDLTWKKGRTNIPVVGELFKENGVPQGIIPEVLDEITEVCCGIHPHPRLSPVYEGQKLQIGERLFEVLDTPGHTDGHISFFNEDEGILISGDYLLPPVFTNVCLWPTSHPNPMEIFLSSIKKVSSLPLKLVLPAHGPSFTDIPGRSDELLNYYNDLLTRVEDLAGSGSTAYRICARLCGAEMGPTQIRFSLTETLAFLACLESRSRVTSRLDGGIVTYRKV